MKHSHIATVISLLLLGSMSANANQSSTELKVGGELTSKSVCNINIGNGGVFNIKKITASTIKDKDIDLETSVMSLNINCDEKIQVSYQIVDNKNGTASTPGDDNFGLGNVNGTGKLGYYKLSAFSGMVDGSQSHIYISDTKLPEGGIPASTAPIRNVVKDSFMGWVNDGRVSSGTNYRLQFMISPVLASIEKMNGNITENTSLDGSATVNLFYGI